MSGTFFTTEPLPEFQLWNSVTSKRIPLSFELEVTARCNNACRHCYINLPASDQAAKRNELSLVEIHDFAQQAVDLGAIWCLVTGGEPLLRRDFKDIFLLLKKQGLLVSVFTNACLVTPEHVKLFQDLPPRDIEITVYGITAETYEAVSRQPGSYKAFRRGLDLLLEGGVKVRLKAMALRSNYQEILEIGRFCRTYTKDYYRFDPLLHLRYDGNPQRNTEIVSERLSPNEIVALEQSDEDRLLSLQKICGSMDESHSDEPGCDHIFHCGAGQNSFTIGYDGTFRLCSSLLPPDCTVDLRKQTLSEAWHGLVPKVRDLRSKSEEFRKTCRICPISDFCLWCPANGYLECGELDGHTDYFCQVARARAEMIAVKGISKV